MKINLYPYAQKWKENGQIWFYSDPHFSDEEMKSIRLNYITDEEQVKRINSKVGKNDTIIFLGDLGDASWINQIKGYKILIKGNHDSGNRNYIRFFNEIYEGILPLSDKIMLSHEPIDLPFMYNIHGHDHAKQYSNDNLHFNACAEHINYTPISLTEIVLSGALSKIDSIHRITIDKATEKKKGTA